MIYYTDKNIVFRIFTLALALMRNDLGYVYTVSTKNAKLSSILGICLHNNVLVELGMQVFGNDAVYKLKAQYFIS